MTLRPLRVVLSVAIALSAFTLLGCEAPPEPEPAAPTLTREPVPSFSAERVRDGLEERFGARLGRMQLRTDGVRAELTGGATDADLAAGLLLFAPTASEDATIEVMFLNPDANWDCMFVLWNPGTGRMRRWKGDGAEFLVLPPPPDGIGYAWSGTYTGEGGLPTGVDAAALERYAEGEPIPWDWSMR